MNIDGWIWNVIPENNKNYISYLFKRIFSNGNYYFSKKKELGEVEQIYLTNSGKKIIIYREYRYSLKSCWKIFEPLKTLDNLKQLNLLNKKEIIILNKAKGYRKLELPLTELRGVVKNIFRRDPSIFLNEGSNLNNDLILAPNFQKVFKDLKNREKEITKKIKFLKYNNICDINKIKNVLEVGFSRGVSIYAFERLGFKAFGIDNDYGQQDSNAVCYDKYLRKSFKSKSTFFYDDIAISKNLENNSFDFVWSESVIEHIQNIDGAIKNIFRVLRRGGLFISSFHPYHSLGGGHSLGIGDSPWLHTILKEKEYLEYIKVIRPFEYELARDWFNSALNRNITQSKIFDLLISNGFEIKLWRVSQSNPSKIAHLNHQIINESFKHNKNISILDLIAENVFFVAKKI